MRANEFVLEADISRRNFLKKAGNAAAATTVPGKGVASILSMGSNVTRAIAELRKLAGRDDTFSDMFRGLFGEQDFFKLPFNLQFSLEDFEDFEEAMAQKGIDVDLYSDEYFDDIIAKHPEATLRQWHQWASKIIGRKTLGAEMFDILDKNGFTSDSLIEKYFLKSPQLTQLFHKIDLDHAEAVQGRIKDRLDKWDQEYDAKTKEKDFDVDDDDFKQKMLSKDHEWDSDDENDADDDKHYSGTATGKFVEPWTAKASPKLSENFADGKGPGRPGDSQRHGIPKKATMAELEKASHAKGRKGQLARWQLNMRRGQKREGVDLASALEEAYNKKSEFSKEAQASIPGITSSGRPDGPINTYQKYRIGIAMACSPDTENVSAIGPTNDDMVTVGYTAADQDISDRAYKALGFKKKRVTSNTSREHDAHTVSPVAKPKPNRYGV